MEVAGAASAILFGIITLVQLLLSFMVLSYAGYSFLTVFVNTSAGTDEVLWPKDPFQDWMWKSWYLAWLLAVWAIPVWLVANFLNPPVWQFALIVGGFLWLMFPLGLLSSLSASSRWVVLRPVIVGMFLGNIGSTLAFYLISGVLIAGWGALFYYAILGPFYFVPLAAFSAASVFLIYARLLGRIGWVFTQQHPEEHMHEDEDEDEEELPPARRPGSTQSGTARGKSGEPDRARPNQPKVDSSDPWAASLEHAIRQGTKPAPRVPSEEPEDPYGPAAGSYDVLPEDYSWRRSPPATNSGEEEIQPYGVASGGDSEHPKYPKYELPPQDKPPAPKRERELAVRYEVPPPPSWPLWSGVYTFPFYPTTLGAFAVMAIGFLGMIILFRTQVDLWPF
jgi:hypothetical protein